MFRNGVLHFLAVEVDKVVLSQVQCVYVHVVRMFAQAWFISRVILYFVLICTLKNIAIPHSEDVPLLQVKYSPMNEGEKQYTHTLLSRCMHTHTCTHTHSHTHTLIHMCLHA